MFKKSWALMGIREHNALVRMLEDTIFDSSVDVIEDAKRQLLDDTPEAYIQREIGLKQERRKRTNK